MKKIYLSILIAIFSFDLSAQITLTSQANTPQVGNSFEYVRVQTLPNTNFRADGANQTWDFSSLSGDTAAIEYIDLSASAEPATFPTADVVEKDPAGIENYYSITDSSQALVGQLIPGIFRASYSDKREYIDFPITFNDVFNETFVGPATNLRAGTTTSRGGDIEIKADGHGDLILPYGTVSDVLRIRTIYNYGDTLSGFVIGSYIDTIYTWYQAGTSTLIASTSLGYANGMRYIAGANYMIESSLVGLEELNLFKGQVSFYPNPAKEQIIVENLTEDYLSIQILDLRGRTHISAESRDPKTPIDITGLSSGLYLVKYQKDELIYTEKLTVH